MTKGRERHQDLFLSLGSVQKRKGKIELCNKFRIIFLKIRKIICNELQRNSTEQAIIVFSKKIILLRLIYSLKIKQKTCVYLYSKIDLCMCRDSLRCLLEGVKKNRRVNLNL